ncbi:MAG TPA: alanine racemase [Phycisphaerae bacterium]|nr:alanine racemase [Phycisphaerae bacterium]
MPRPTYAEVDLAAVRHNLRTLRARLAPGVQVLGVVKANAYGHGAVEVSRALEAEAVDLLGVALVEEGAQLRAAGIRSPVLVMGALPADDVAAAIEQDLTPTVDGPETAGPIEACAARQGRTVAVHLKIDTGMNRLGVRAEAAAEAAAALGRMKHLRLAGAYTHFACADCEADDVSPGQLARFRSALAAMQAAGLRPPLVHAANSSALLVLSESHFDMVRSGLALYGICPCPAARAVPLRPALALKSRVACLKAVRAGEGVSYGHRWRAARESLIGVLPIGYADGYPRALSDGGQVRVEGRLVPVVGAVCMDMTMIDLTGVPGVGPGQEVTLIEADNSSPISAAAVAEQAGTIPYEILTGLSKRLPRTYR